MYADPVVFPSFPHSNIAQAANGGVLSVAKDGKARFFENATTRDIRLYSTADQLAHGGCIYSEVGRRLESSFLWVFERP